MCPLCNVMDFFFIQQVLLLNCSVGMRNLTSNLKNGKDDTIN